MSPAKPPVERLTRTVEAEVRPTASFADGILEPEAAPCMSGTPSVPNARNPTLSGDVLRAYETYQKEVSDAAGWPCLKGCLTHTLVGTIGVHVVYG